MKKKSESKKKPAKKAGKGFKLIMKKEPTVVIRQIKAMESSPGTKHLVRVVNDCTASTLVFSSTEELNEFLFQWEMEHQGENPEHSGSWIDLIVTGIDGEIADLEQLEAL